MENRINTTDANTYKHKSLNKECKIVNLSQCHLRELKLVSHFPLLWPFYCPNTQDAFNRINYLLFTLSKRQLC